MLFLKFFPDFMLNDFQRLLVPLLHSILVFAKNATPQAQCRTLASNLQKCLAKIDSKKLANKKTATNNKLARNANNLQRTKTNMPNEILKLKNCTLHSSTRQQPQQQKQSLLSGAAVCTPLGAFRYCPILAILARLTRHDKGLVLSKCGPSKDLGGQIKVMKYPDTRIL